jgi:hypothetical protein
MGVQVGSRSQICNATRNRRTVLVNRPALMPTMSHAAIRSFSAEVIALMLVPPRDLEVVEEDRPPRLEARKERASGVAGLDRGDAAHQSAPGSARRVAVRYSLTDLPLPGCRRALGFGRIHQRILPWPAPASEATPPCTSASRSPGNAFTISGVEIGRHDHLGTAPVDRLGLGIVPGHCPKSAGRAVRRRAGARGVACAS